jgi:hypothetical protein
MLGLPEAWLGELTRQLHSSRAVTSGYNQASDNPLLDIDVVLQQT